MGIDHAQQRFCDDCGRVIAKASRVYRGKDYCRSCYQRTFVSVPCSQCSRSTRVHRHDHEPPVCPACIRATRLCARCGKACPKAGMLLGSTKEAVCPACVPRVSEPRTCPQCKKPSARLSRPLPESIDLVCDRCCRLLTHATCGVCRRYRRVAGHYPNDQPYCASCAPGREVTHACPGCGQTVPGGGAGRCRTCLTRDAVRHEASQVTGLALWVHRLWTDFVASQTAGERLSPRLRTSLRQAAEFFQSLGEAFPSPDALNAKTLVQALGPKALRRHLLASRFVLLRLEHSGVVDSAEMTQARAAHVERQRHDQVLVDAQATPYGPLLEGYAQALRDQAVAPRTARMYLRAAERFCAQVHVDGQVPWSAVDLQSYLVASPGQGASLARFVSHCGTARGWNVAMPARDLWKSTLSDDQKSFRRFKRVLRLTAMQYVETLSTKALAALFGHSLGVSAAYMLRHRRDHGAPRNADGAIVVLPDAVIGPRHSMHPHARRWAELAERHAARRPSQP